MVGLDREKLRYVEENTAGQIKDSAVWDGIGKPIYSPGHHDRISFCVEIISRLRWTRLLDVGPLAAPIIRLYNLWLQGLNICFDVRVTHVMTRRERLKRGETVAMDITCAACHYYRDNKIYDHVVRASWDLPPFRDNAFDLVLWSEGPEHAVGPEEVMGKIAKLTRRWIVTSAPNWDPKAAFDHYHAISMDRLCAMVSVHFRIVEKYVIPPNNWQVLVGENV